MFCRSCILACLFVISLCLTPLSSRQISFAAAPHSPPTDVGPTRAAAQFSDDVGGGNSVVIGNPSLVAIPDDGYAGVFGTGMACSDVNTAPFVSLNSMVHSVRVNVQADHTWIGDLTIKLRSPVGTILTILNRPVSSAPDNGADNPVGDNSNWASTTTIGFGDGLGPEAETMGNSLADAQNICINDGICFHDPSPDTATTPPTAFAAFRNQPARGVWRLCVGDSALLDTGNLRGWSLDLTFAAAFEVNPNPNNIPDDGYVGGFGGAGQRCSNITVPSLPGAPTVQGTWVSASLNHTWVGDLTLKLRSPSGTIFTFLNRPGSNAADDGGGAVGANANWNGSYLHFGDGFGPEAETLGAGLTTDQVVCTANGICEFDPSPDTAAGPTSFATAFNGQATAGVWTLCAGDSALGDVGVINSWRLNLVNVLVPTAAGVEIGGRVRSQLGSSIYKARVKLVDQAGNERTALTNPFGYYAFDDVEVGQTYLVVVEAKGYSFKPRSVSVVDAVTDLDFVGQPGLDF